MGRRRRPDRVVSCLITLTIGWCEGIIIIFFDVTFTYAMVVSIGADHLFPRINVDHFLRDLAVDYFCIHERLAWTVG